MNPTLPLTPFRSRLRLPKPPHYMTLVLGIKCKDALVFAADSQVTEDDVKWTDATKLRVLEFKSFPVLAAQAGSVIHSNRYLDILEEIGHDETPTTPIGVGLLAVRAMTQLKRELKEIHPDGDLDEKILNYRISYDIILGFFLNGKPELITVNLFSSIYGKNDRLFEAAGSGSVLGAYLLKEHITPNIGHKLATRLAIYIVDAVKDYDNFCSGKTHVGIMLKPSGLGGSKGRPYVKILDANTVAQYTAQNFDADKSTRQLRNHILHTKITEEEASLNAELDKIIAELAAGLPPLTTEDIENMADSPDTPDIIEEDEDARQS